MIRWFKTRRALVNMLDERGDIIAKQIDEIANLRTEMDEGWQRATTTENRLMRQRDEFRLNAGTERQGRIDAEAKLAAVVAELHKLRAEIREAENPHAAFGVGVDRVLAEGNPPSATGAGMACPPRPRFDRTATRLRQGLPADLVEAIDEETAMKRRLDGEGDE